MGLALNQENYRLLTSPKREKNSNRSQQAKNIKRNNDGVFVKSKNAIEKTEIILRLHQFRGRNDELTSLISETIEIRLVKNDENHRSQYSHTNINLILIQ